MSQGKKASSRGALLARELAKLASSGISALSVGRAIARTAKGAVVGGGDFGAGVAEGLGASPGIGRVVGMGATGLAGLGVAGRAKRKVDEFRYRNGIY